MTVGLRHQDIQPQTYFPLPASQGLHGNTETERGGEEIISREVCFQKVQNKESFGL